MKISNKGLIDDDDDDDDDDDASPVVVAGPGRTQAFAVYIYIYIYVSISQILYLAISGIRGGLQLRGVAVEAAAVAGEVRGRISRDAGMVRDGENSPGENSCPVEQ